MPQKYVKTIHEEILYEYAKFMSRTLDIASQEIGDLCKHSKNGAVCIQWGKEKELTCFCLESIF